MLAWNSMLYKIEHGRIKTQLSNEKEYSKVLASLTEHLEANQHLYQMLLVTLVPFLPLVQKSSFTGLSVKQETEKFAPEYCDISSVKDSKTLALTTLINFMKNFPSLARKFYGECERYIIDHTFPYIRQIVSPAIMEHEIKKIELSQASL
jgi:hypothetical protein